MVRGTMERLPTTRFQRIIIIRNWGYKRILEDYKKNLKKDSFLATIKSLIDFYVYFLIPISL